MKKIIGLLFAIVLSAAAVSAEDAPQIGALDASAGLTFNLYPANTIDPALQPFLVLLSLRGGVDVDARFILADELSVGAGVGIYYMTINDYTMFDLPVYGLVRFGSQNTFAEVQVGYYISTGLLKPEYGSGLYAGIRGSLESFFVEADLVFAPMGMFERFGIGYVLSNFLKF